MPLILLVTDAHKVDNVLAWIKRWPVTPTSHRRMKLNRWKLTSQRPLEQRGISKWAVLLAGLTLKSLLSPVNMPLTMPRRATSHVVSVQIIKIASAMHIVSKRDLFKSNPMSIPTYPQSRALEPVIGVNRIRRDDGSVRCWPSHLLSHHLQPR